MKTSLLFVLFGMGFASTAFRSDGSSLAVRPHDDFASIYIYRGRQYFGSALNYALFANGEKICKLSNNRFIEYKTKPGKLSLTAHTGGVGLIKKETGLDLTVEAGKKYYVKGDQKTSLIRTRLELLEVSENTAKREMIDMAVDACQE
ncbi:DUF2846 domain-containing protein [Spirosoma aerophilum]